MYEEDQGNYRVLAFTQSTIDLSEALGRAAEPTSFSTETKQAAVRLAQDLMKVDTVIAIHVCYSKTLELAYVRYQDSWKQIKF